MAGLDTLADRAQARWELTCDRLRLPMQKEFPVIWNLYSRMSEPGDHLVYTKTLPPRGDLQPQLRPYHGIRHVLDCLAEYDAIRSLVDNPNPLEVALWQHDMIYTTGWHDTLAEFNEELTTIAALSLLRRYNAPESLIKQVKPLILITNHRTQPITTDEKLMVDIDLSILGKPEEEFDKYDAAIRQEYEWAPEEEYRKGRKQILEGFLQRDSIYQTRHFMQKYEAQAQANLKRAIKRLDQAA